MENLNIRIITEHKTIRESDEEFNMVKELGVSLRELKIEDGAGLAEIVGNKKVLDNMDDIPNPGKIEDSEEFIHACLNEDDPKIARAICYDGNLIGWIGVIRRDNIRRLTGEMGYYIAEDYWGKGIMTEAVRLMCAYIFESTDIVRIFAEPYAFNAASCRVLEKAGFTFEGLLRQNAIKNGHILDMKLYAMLKTDVELANSLSANTTELIPYLPYILQDYWELGSDPDVMVRLIEKHSELAQNSQILDLACGKGAVSVKIADRLGVRVKGIDITPEFIEYARQKSKEYGTESLCEFTLGDINEAVKTERDYDCVILGAVGPGVLGGPAETLRKLKSVVKPGGYILIEDGFIADESYREKIRHNKDIHLTERQWHDFFEEAGLTLCETASGFGEGEMDNVSGMAAITKRANELIEKHPDKKALIEGYVRSQQNEYDDIDNELICVTWILRKNKK